MILSESSFRQMFDSDRITQLASGYSPSSGKSAYNSAIVTGAIAQAEGVALSSLSKMYSTLQVEADAGMKRIIGSIAMYYLESRRGTPPPEVKQMYNDSLEFISSLQSGESKLAVVDQLLPIGNEEEPTEATDSGFFD